MRKKNRAIAVAVGTTAFALGWSASALAGYPVAGVQPDQRPAGAPVIEEATKGDAWYAQALTGVSQPYPPSLKFLEDQGNWYTPFNRPGATPPYDIRGWYR